MARRCAALYPPITDTTEHSFDSTQTLERIQYRDVPIYIPQIGEPIVLTDALSNLKDGYNYQNSKGPTSLHVKVQGTNIIVDCKTDSLTQLLARVADTLRTVRSTKTQYFRITVTRTIETKVPKLYIPWWLWLYLSLTILWFVGRIRYRGVTLLTRLGTVVARV